MNVKATMMAIAAGAMLAGGMPDYLEAEGAPRSKKQPRKDKQFTAFDQERLDKAEAKRERKAIKRQFERADEEARNLDIEFD